MKECSVTGEKQTYASLRDNIARWSGFLQKIGVSQGDTVAIISPNSIEYPSIFMGTIAIGAIISPFNPNYTVSEFIFR